MRGLQAADVEEYLRQLPTDEARSALARLRALIREELPDAVEVISYGIPAFKLKVPVVFYAAFKNHCSFFAGTTIGAFTEDLSGYKISKGTIQFKPEKPIPDELVKAIVRARVAELGGKG